MIMRPTTTIKRIYRRVILRLYRKSLENELCVIIGVPGLFSPIAPLLWAAAVCFIIVAGFCGWLEGV